MLRPGVQDEYVETARRIAGPEKMAEWEQTIRAEIDEMMVVTITPTWIKIIDVEREFPEPRCGLP